MASTEKKITRGKLRSSYIATVVSITLVLFTLGFLSLVLLHGREISNYVKENIGFTIVLKQDVKDVDVVEIQKTLDAEKYVKGTHLINKEEAAGILQKDLGEDFIDLLGYNPLHTTIDVKLNADYANQDSLAWIEQKIMNTGHVREVFYQKDLVQIMNKRLKQITFWMLVVSGLLLLISIVLINSSIRLAIYSKRFLIKTMQLVGARHSFIRRPFVIQGIFNGLLSAMLAIAGLIGLLYFARLRIEELREFSHFELYGATFLFIIVMGVLISWLSTTMAVRKYLRLQTRELY